MRLISLAFLVPALCLAQALPRLQVDASHHDFGPVPPDTLQVHRYKATNTGPVPLTILKVQPVCGCTTMVLGKAVLAPGEDTEVEVTFNTAGQQGQVRKSLNIETDDPAVPIQTLTFEADVLADLKNGPRSVSFHDLARPDRRTASIRLESTTGKPIHLDKVELSEAPWLGVTTREEGLELWVDFTLVAEKLPAARLHGTDTAILLTTNPRPSTTRLAVEWDLLPPVTVAPERVSWSQPSGREARMPLTLHSRTDTPFRILSVRTSNPLLEVQGVAPKAAVSHQIVVVLSAKAPPSIYDEAVTLTLDTPGHPELDIRVGALLR